MVSEKSKSKLDSSKTIKKSKNTGKGLENSKFTKFLFDGIIYCVGDYLLLRETNKTVAVA